MADSKLRELSTDFAVKIIKLCETIKGHYSLVNQLERSATSIGANIHEANYAHGKPDFIAKLQIALKECYLLLPQFCFVWLPFQRCLPLANEVGFANDDGYT